MRQRRCGRGIYSLAGLIFGIVSFSIVLAIKTIGVVFNILFGLISGIGLASGSSHTAENAPREPSEIKTEGREKESRKRPDTKDESEAKAAGGGKQPGEGNNKDFYIVLFILTIIPAIVALAIGNLFYAGVIGAAGFGIMLTAGVISGIVNSFRRRVAEKATEEDKEGQKENDSLENLIKDASGKLDAIRKDIGGIKDADIRARIEAVCRTGEKIIEEVRTNPEGLAYVRKFFYYYIDAFGEIVRKYLRLSGFEESSEEVSKLVDETERSFEDINEIFKDLCEKLLEKDMMNLKAEINVIKSSN